MEELLETLRQGMKIFGEAVAECASNVCVQKAFEGAQADNHFLLNVFLG